MVRESDQKTSDELENNPAFKRAKSDFLVSLQNDLVCIESLLVEDLELCSVRQISAIAHRLRGTAGCFGLQAAGELMGQIEDTCARYELSDVDRLGELHARIIWYLQLLQMTVPASEPESVPSEKKNSMSVPSKVQAAMSGGTRSTSDQECGRGR